MALKILITNDDGIDCLGIRLLIQKAKRYGEVVVYAPLVEQSAKSHSINIRNGMMHSVKNLEGIDCNMVDSTPADCVRYAVYKDKADFDIVFSGINDGYNLGEDIAYSGTVSAACEAVYTGHIGIAFSSYPHGYDGIDIWFDKVMDYIFNNKLLEIGKLYNINFPKNPKGIKITKQGSVHFDTFFEKEEEKYYQKGKPDFTKDANILYSDVACVLEDYISITPLTVDKTDYDVFKKLV